MLRPSARRAAAVIVLLAVIGAATAAHRLWPTGGDEPIHTDSGVAYRRVTHGGDAYLVVDVDLTRAMLRQYWREPDGARYGNFGKLWSALETKGGRLVFATNGGIFDPTRTPVGLYVEGGVERVPLNLADGVGNFYLKPNGVFLLGSNGAAVVQASAYAAARRTPDFALQSGPLLLAGGHVHPGFDRGSDNRRVRSAVGTPGPWRATFVLSEQPVTFFELATLFRDRLGCPDALYLDGEISQAYAPAAGRHDLGGQFAGIVAVTSGTKVPR